MAARRRSGTSAQSGSDSAGMTGAQAFRKPSQFPRRVLPDCGILFPEPPQARAGLAPPQLAKSRLDADCGVGALPAPEKYRLSA
ncbi:hypothetical protein CBM2626_U40016 [Cupriavidus taiwanensis]|uniref:Uncharacterized protein n=1 Tax=Cupriavidus taiwanensis TaxID=164546 RepID=A0A375HFP0_9BURK|nr:hypothetical protein CBM2626_U40016 [Cupriavidus taiwanensis]SPA12937.1 hypothetical protein CBM2625_U70003 [Cupriavidus taiwanensis]SPA57685.1 hypothetical protein CBM2638_U20019 [Cupriavidus taiwanensis]SPD49070.1 protein of unknown function [Cupriavidus taiwanensis]